MKNQRHSGPASSTGSMTNLPRKKKEKAVSSTQIDAERDTGFMHSLIGEEAIQDNRQRLQNIDDSRNIAMYGGDNICGNYQLNESQGYSDDNLYMYQYQIPDQNNHNQNNQNTQNNQNNQSNMGMTTGMNNINNSNNDTSQMGNNSNGYDYTKAFQMMPMQRFIGSNGQDSYKYDSTAHQQHQQLTGETMRQQPRSQSYVMNRDMNRDIPNNNEDFKFYSNSSNQTQGNQNNQNNMNNMNDENGDSNFSKKEGDRGERGGGDREEAECESESQSIAGDNEGDPGKRKTRNQREQKRSLKISEQIDMLGQLLSNNGIDVKINKYNILSKVFQFDFFAYF